MGDIIVSIDIGTSKVSSLICQIGKDDNLVVLGKGLDVCNGVKKGIIADIESTAYSIKKSLGQAESMAGVKVCSAYVNIMGAHVNLLNNRCSIPITNDKKEITSRDIERIFYLAKDIDLEEDSQVIDVIPKQFIIDGVEKIVDPIGMTGDRLEMDAEIIASKTYIISNIVKTMEKADLKLDGIIVEPMAQGEVALTPEEKEMGVILLDIGGGVTNIAVFEGNELMFCGAVPVGGDHISNDISIGLKVSLSEAENLKREYEIALTSLIKNDQTITVNEINECKKKSIKVSEVVQIIEARTHEIFVLCRELLEKSEMMKIYSGGIVLTGCGISYVDGSEELSSEVFRLPTRIASFKGSNLPGPDYAIAHGIIKFMMLQGKINSDIGSEIKQYKSNSSEESFWSKIIKFLGNIF